MFYFTDNMTTYFIVQGGSSSSPNLHELIRRIKDLEIKLGCRLEVIHVPGELMIKEGTDDLSRGVWLGLERIPKAFNFSARALDGVTPTPTLTNWLLNLCGYASSTPHTKQGALDPWDFPSMAGQLSMWYPTPEIARQAVSTFLTAWVELPLTTAAIFAVPRAMQKDWAYINRHVHMVGEFHPQAVPGLTNCCLPLVVLHVPVHVRVLDTDDRVEPPSTTPRFERWHREQADEVRGL
jgi:hypothetical protein